MAKPAARGNGRMRLCFGWHADSTRTRFSSALPFAVGLPRSNAEDPILRRRHFDLVGNKGFLVVGEATLRIFSCNREGSAAVDLRSLAAGAKDPQELARSISHHFDALVLGMAYDINPQADYSALLPFLEHLSIPVVTLGLSISKQDLDPGELHPSVLQFLHLLSRRASLFGIRAESTQEWLERHGITGSVALGCPSLHLYPQALLNPPARRRSTADSLFATGGYLFRNESRARGLATLFAGKRVDYILQDEIFELADEDLAQIAFDDAICEFSATDVNRYAREWLKQDLPFRRYFLFDEMDSWRQNLSVRDCYVGDRFHGAVAAIQARLPTVIICKDVRSQELASFYGMPSTGLEAAVERGLEDLLDEALSPRSLALTKALYRERAATFERRIGEAGLELNVPIDALAV